MYGEKGKGIVHVAYCGISLVLHASVPLMQTNGLAREGQRGWKDGGRPHKPEPVPLRGSPPPAPGERREGIWEGRPGPGLLAHVLVNKYADHLPLYRQSQIFGRDGVDLDRSTLAGWVGKSAALLEPLAEAIQRLVLKGQGIFADDTPVNMLSPGAGKTKTARLSAYVRDERPWAGVIPPFLMGVSCRTTRPFEVSLPG